MIYFSTFINDFWLLLNEFSFFILLGVVIVGFLHVIVPVDFIPKHLQKSNFKSVLKAGIFGIPLPLCSCGVIPMAKSLHKAGASKGSVMSFMISTPITGVDSIAATYGIFGFLFAIYRIISSLCIALVAGLIMNFFDNKNKQCKTKNHGIDGTFETQKSCCSSVTENTQASCCTSKKEMSKVNFLSSKIMVALDYGFNNIFKSLSMTLLIGIILGTLIGMILPENLGQFLKEHYILSFLMVLVISVPLYICATASLPIAASLVLSGFSPGAAFVFLSAGPATNAVDFTFILNLMGKKALVIYISTIAIGSLIFGYLIDLLLQFQGLNINNFNTHIMYEKGWLDYISSIIILCLFFKFLVYDKYFKRK